MRFRAASSILAQYCLTYTQQCSYRTASQRDSVLQKNDTGFLALFHGVIVPHRGLHLPDMGGAHQEHAQAGLSDAAADGKRQLARQQFTAERADERSTNSMNITYTQNGDYLIPNIIIRKTKPLGHYGRLRKAYLEMHRPILFNELVLSDRLFEHCAEIDEAAQNRMELIVPQLAKQYGVTERLKAENQMEWVRQMNACKAQAEEVVKAELIYD